MSYIHKQSLAASLLVKPLTLLLVSVCILEAGVRYQKKRRWIVWGSEMCCIKRNHWAFHNHSSHTQTSPVNVNNQLPWIPHQNLDEMKKKKMLSVMWCLQGCGNYRTLHVFIFNEQMRELGRILEWLWRGKVAGLKKKKKNRKGPMKWHWKYKCSMSQML